MKKIENKIKILTEKIKDQNETKNEILFLNEMKKIGIEKLPYSYSALKQFIDPETMSYHYNNHYKGYVDKLNDALSKKNYGDLDLEQIVRTINKFDKTIRNNAGGAFNHALFWKMLSPTEQKCGGKILAKIKKDFKSFREFKTEFETKSKTNFGSGWVWLVYDEHSNDLEIIIRHNQDHPLCGKRVLFGLDVWEHAYYLNYQNRRPDYINAFWNVINWTEVAARFKAAK
jgi:Fe-Mn family superoxide dismutase